MEPKKGVSINSTYLKTSPNLSATMTVAPSSVKIISVAFLGNSLSKLIAKTYFVGLISTHLEFTKLRSLVSHILRSLSSAHVANREFVLFTATKRTAPECRSLSEASTVDEEISPVLCDSIREVVLLYWG